MNLKINPDNAIEVCKLAKETRRDADEIANGILTMYFRRPEGGGSAAHRLVNEVLAAVNRYENSLPPEPNLWPKQAGKRLPVPKARYARADDLRKGGSLSYKKIAAMCGLNYSTLLNHWHRQSKRVGGESS